MCFLFIMQEKLLFLDTNLQMLEINQFVNSDKNSKGELAQD